MKNNDVRKEIKAAGFYIWEVAEAIGISDVTMSKRLRKELSSLQKQEIRNAIEIIRSSRR